MNVNVNVNVDFDDDAVVEVVHVMMLRAWQMVDGVMVRRYDGGRWMRLTKH